MYSNSKPIPVQSELRRTIQAWVSNSQYVLVALKTQTVRYSHFTCRAVNDVQLILVDAGTAYDQLKH